MHLLNALLYFVLVGLASAKEKSCPCYTATEFVTGSPYCPRPTQPSGEECPVLFCFRAETTTITIPPATKSCSKTPTVTILDCPTTCPGCPSVTATRKGCYTATTTKFVGRPPICPACVAQEPPFTPTPNPPCSGCGCDSTPTITKTATYSCRPCATGSPIPAIA